MSYTVDHVLVHKKNTTVIDTSDGVAIAKFSDSGTMTVDFPGKIKVDALARCYHWLKVDDLQGGRPRWQRQVRDLRLKVEIKTPAGTLFTADHVTLADLAQFRDLGGATRYPWTLWTYRVIGESAPVHIDEGEERYDPGPAFLRIAILETVPSKSAYALLTEELTGRSAVTRLKFDLWRVGTFWATGRFGIASGRDVSAILRLRNPDGLLVAESRTGELRYPIALRTLDVSRDTAGNSRAWVLEAERPGRSPLPGSVTATVVGTARIVTEALTSRIYEVIGQRGANLSIYAEVVDGRLLGRIKVLDETSAALIERYNVLKRVLKPEDPHDNSAVDDVVVENTYTLYNESHQFGGHFKVQPSGITVGTIDIEIGESVKIQPPVPALKIAVEVPGSAKIEFKGIDLAKAKLRNHRIQLEMGLRLAPDGTFSLVPWIDDDLFDVDIATDALSAALALGLGLTAALAAEKIESELNRRLAGALQAVLDSAASQVPHILATFLGDHFTYRSLRFEGQAIVFEDDAPFESDPKPDASYRGIIGRSVDQLGHNVVRIRPPSLGDTWAADKLRNIDHIVVVMMENRSFDHVLGYLAAQGVGNSDGLTPELIGLLASEENKFTVPLLRELKTKKLPDGKVVISSDGTPVIGLNRVGLRTKFPLDVGHSLGAVAVQLEKKLVMESGRSINSPQGFCDDFAPRIEEAHLTETMVPEAVLGYYDAKDLPFYKFLTDNYAWCERFYSSHPGPTMPNRMFSLAGEPQRNRSGEAILNNNKGDNFVLSRAPTIFDLLTRKGIGWRVYESYPSVTMLRFFARYATDNTNIVKFEQLAQDVAEERLPSVVFIDPAMHTDPQNDDHPPADMYRGQLFLEGVYNTLRAKEAVWSKTLLLITYDEHGGFYDHVIPPIADLRTRPLTVVDGPTGSGNFTPDTLNTYYGVRVPTFVVSPWVSPGKGPDLVLDFCSILKTILARFCGDSRPFLSDRVHSSQSFEAYLTAAAPRLVASSVPLPPLPGPIRRGRVITTAPLFRRQMRAGNADFHDMGGMLARMLGRDSRNPVA